MNINHLNLTVSDVDATVDFLEKYFGLRRMGGNKGMAFMLDGNGMVLTLMKGGRNGEVRYPGSFHIGFAQESEERVNELNARLKEDGYDVEPPQRSHAWTFYVLAPGGFMVEVLC